MHLIYQLGNHSFHIKACKSWIILNTGVLVAYACLGVFIVGESFVVTIALDSI